MIACLATLAVFAWRVPIAAQPQHPTEDAALIGVGITALLMGSWLAPVLLSTGSKTLIAAASIVPLLLIANFLRGFFPSEAVPGIALTLAWIGALQIAVRWRWLGQTLAVVSVLGPAGWYLAQEFAPSPFHFDSALAAISPPLGAAAIFSHTAWSWVPFWPPALLIGLEIVRFSFLHRHARRDHGVTVETKTSR